MMRLYELLTQENDVEQKYYLVWYPSTTNTNGREVIEENLTMSEAYTYQREYTMAYGGIVWIREH